MVTDNRIEITLKDVKNDSPRWFSDAGEDMTGVIMTSSTGTWLVFSGSEHVSLRPYRGGGRPIGGFIVEGDIIL